jgi:hypothetical protein
MYHEISMAKASGDYANQNLIWFRGGYWGIIAKFIALVVL